MKVESGSKNIKYKDAKEYIDTIINLSFIKKNSKFRINPTKFLLILSLLMFTLSFAIINIGDMTNNVLIFIGKDLIPDMICFLLFLLFTYYIIIYEVYRILKKQSIFDTEFTKNEIIEYIGKGQKCSITYDNVNYIICSKKFVYIIYSNNNGVTSFFPISKRKEIIDELSKHIDDVNSLILKY